MIELVKRYNSGDCAVVMGKVTVLSGCFENENGKLSVEHYVITTL